MKAVVYREMAVVFVIIIQNALCEQNAELFVSYLAVRILATGL